MRVSGLFLILVLTASTFSGAFAQPAEAPSFWPQPTELTDSLLRAHNVPVTKVRKAEKLAYLLSCGKKRPKLTAVVLAVMLGPLGVHRLYLGTATKVPIIYTVTLGGGMGILVLCDIVAIIGTKDIARYFNNPKVVMWINPQKE